MYTISLYSSIGYIKVQELSTTKISKKGQLLDTAQL